MLRCSEISAFTTPTERFSPCAPLRRRVVHRLGFQRQVGVPRADCIHRSDWLPCYELETIAVEITIGVKMQRRPPLNHCHHSNAFLCVWFLHLPPFEWQKKWAATRHHCLLPSWLMGPRLDYVPASSVQKGWLQFDGAAVGPKVSVWIKHPPYDCMALLAVVKILRHNL